MQAFLIYILIVSRAAPVLLWDVWAQPFLILSASRLLGALNVLQFYDRLIVRYIFFGGRDLKQK